VYLGLRFRQTAKDVQSPLLRPGPNISALYQFPDIPPGPVRMPMTGAGVVIVIVMMMMAIFRFPQIDDSADSADPAALIPDKVQFPAIKTELPQFGPQEVPVYPQINQGSQGHISRNPGKTIKVKDFHVVSPPLV
jgi:hypothetical protein